MDLSTLPRHAPRLRTDLAAVRFLAFDETIQIPAQGVGDMTEDELADLEQKATDAFQGLASKDDPSDADVAEAERLAGIVTEVRTESEQRSAAVEGRRNKLNDLAQQVGQPADGGDEDEGDAAGVEDEAPASDAAPASAPVADETPEQIAASAAAPARTRTRAADVATRQTKPLAPVRKPVALTAAPDAPNMAQGATYQDIGAVAEAIVARASEYPSAPFEGEARVKMRHGIAVLRKDFEAGLVAKASTDADVLEFAATQSRLPGGSLVAAGGWCAPSETLYDLAEIEAADGLVDLPEIQVNRGGIRFTPGPDFRSIFQGSSAGTGFSQTEAQAIAGQTKPCYKIDCPPFQEERAGVEGLCITNSILQNRAYPELTARVVRGALAAHAHRISAKTIARMVALSTAVPALLAQGGAAAPILNAIELGVEDIRYRHRMARTATLEAVFPAWIMGVIRADLAFRLGVENFMSIPDSEIRKWFTDRHIVPQFVYDWQDSALGQSVAATRWPATVKFLLYPAGTFVRGMGEVITLDTVYDSAGLAQNEYTGLFTEEQLMVAKLGHESRVYEVPVCADGSTAAGVDIPCTAAA